MAGKAPQPGSDVEAFCRATLSGDGVLVAFEGHWCMHADVPDLLDARRLLGQSPRPAMLRFETSGLLAWDSRFVVFCRSLLALARLHGMDADLSGLPEGARELLSMAEKVPAPATVAGSEASGPLLSGLRGWSVRAWRDMFGLLEFIGGLILACGKLIRGRAVFQTASFVHLLRQTGVDALPVVSLMNLLAGMILAFVASIQLAQFGAQLYVSTIVGIAMIRVMGALMTGIVMASRTGSAFASELGTMQVAEEIDALRTLGFPPTEFLVLPRVLALALTMPLLCVYADVMGVVGGFIVGVGLLGIDSVQYLAQTYYSIPPDNFWIGLTHGAVFGVIVALAGCHRGMRCGRSAQAVGQAATSAAVTGVMGIIIATAVITWLENLLGW